MSSWLWNQVKKRWWIMLPAVWLALVLFFYPFRFVFEFDGDEGFKLMQAFLLTLGHPLYTSIFAEHPPVFVFVLSWIIRVAGNSVVAGRLLVLFSSLSLMLCAGAYLRAFWGNAHAAAVVPLLAILPFFNRLSVSVMIGLPAVALGMAAFLCFAYWQKSRRDRWLVLSALAFSLSTMTKLFTVWLGPAIVVGMLLEAAGEGSKSYRALRTYRPVLLWGIVVALVWAGFAIGIIGPANLHYLYADHLEARQVTAFIAMSKDFNINTFLSDSWPILGMSVVGTVLALKRRQWTSLTLTLWMGTSYVFLLFTVPVWYHHQLIVTVPGAVLAAIFVGEVLQRFLEAASAQELLTSQAFLSLAGCLLAVFVIGARIPDVASEFKLDLPNLRAGNQVSTQEFDVLALMWKHADVTNLVIADRPMFAFRIDKPVPPNLALYSEKRIRTQALTTETILQEIDELHPEQVLFARFLEPEIHLRMKRGYGLIYQLGPYFLYLRSDLEAAHRDPAISDSPVLRRVSQMGQMGSMSGGNAGIGPRTTLQVTQMDLSPWKSP